MKIGILTLPLGSNYGGIMQAYALCSVLRAHGHQPVIIDRRKRRKYYILRKVKRWLELFMYYLFRKDTHIQNNVKYRYSYQFLSDYLSKTQEIINNKQLKEVCAREQFDVFIVGSDQVWRKKYVPDIYDYFLNFCKNNHKVIKLVYAASFGVDYWEYSEDTTNDMRELVHQFSGLSVRESSGVFLCREYLGIEPSLVIDPTLLLKTSEYESLIEGRYIHQRGGGIVAYFLDNNNDKQRVLKSLTKVLGYDVRDVSPRKTSSYKEYRKNPNKCICLPVEEWLTALKTAEFVVTDSYHGTLFSIIFHKSFVSIINESRGIARFQSILGQLGLEDKLCYNYENTNISQLLNPISWNSVDLKLEALRNMSLDFLLASLKNDAPITN